MTTIIASYCYDSKNEPAVVLGADYLASYTRPVQGQDAIHLIQKKDFVRKIQKTPDDALVWAMTGAASPQYRLFCQAVNGKTPIAHFNLVDELNTGRSKTIAQLNLEAMTSNGSHLDTRSSFGLAIVHRTPQDINLWYVTEAGFTTKKPTIFAGSGSTDAEKAYEVLTNLDIIPGGSQLQREAWLVFQSLRNATLNDKHSSGIDIVVIRKNGIDSITHEPDVQSNKVYYEALNEKCKALEPAPPAPAAPPAAAPTQGTTQNGTKFF